jgi:hypothetical protein
MVAMGYEWGSFSHASMQQISTLQTVHNGMQQSSYGMLTSKKSLSMTLVFLPTMLLYNPPQLMVNYVLPNSQD